MASQPEDIQDLETTQDRVLGERVHEISSGLLHKALQMSGVELSLIPSLVACNVEIIGTGTNTDGIKLETGRGLRSQSRIDVGKLPVKVTRDTPCLGSPLEVQRFVDPDGQMYSRPEDLLREGWNLWLPDEPQFDQLVGMVTCLEILQREAFIANVSLQALSRPGQAF